MKFNKFIWNALTFATVLILSACASQERPSSFSSDPVFAMQPSLVKVEAKPDGVKVDLDLASGTTLSCLSPCEFDTSGRRIRAIKISGEGLETLSTDRPFVDNSYNRDVIGFKLRPNFEAIISGRLLPPGQREILDQEIATRKTAPANCPVDAALSPDAVPLTRLPPRMPVNLGKSGTCNMTFNVNTYGYVVEPRADCTDERFAPAATQSVRQWTFAPSIRNGNPASICGVTTAVKFRMMNARGEMLPE